MEMPHTQWRPPEPRPDAHPDPTQTHLVSEQPCELQDASLWGQALASRK